MLADLPMLRFGVDSACTDPRISILNSTGTMVKDSARLASREPITESDSGENRYFAVPCSRKTGTKTMQMHKVDRNVGIATSRAPVHDRLAERLVHGDVPLDVLDDHRAVIDQDADRQCKAAERHGIQRLAGQIR